MKKLIFLALILFPHSVRATELQYRETICNARYNNRGVVAADVKCKAWFDSNRRLNKVDWFYPKTNSWYKFSTTSKAVSIDPKWNECVRYTFPEGNQWQICTVPNPDQLNIKGH